MGYTHYWEFHQVPSAEKFAEFIEGVKHLTATAQEAGIDIGSEKYESNSLRFNGVGAGEHEDFFIPLPIGDERYDYGFCKTARKPYDTAVTASLILAKKIFGEDIEIRSDGRWIDWEGGQLLFESVYDIQPESVLA